MKIQLSDHFTYKKTNQIYYSIYHHDDLHLYLQRGRRLLRIQLCGQDSLCGSQSHYASAANPGNRGLYVRHRRNGLDLQHLRSRGQRKGELVFFSHRLCNFGLGLSLAILGFLFIHPIATLLGASGELLGNCVVYARIILFKRTGWLCRLLCKFKLHLASVRIIGQLFCECNSLFCKMILHFFCHMPFPFGSFLFYGVYIGNHQQRNCP